AYEWSTGETDSIIHVNRPGLYSVTVTDIFGFESSDDIRVFYPQVNDFADTIVCLGETAIWDLELAGDYSYQWYGSGDNQRFIEINSEGQYAAIITDTFGCQYKTDTINFSFDNYELTASIGPADTTLCAGNRLLLVSNADETVSWEWSTAETGFEIVLATTGEYSVTTTNWRGCEAIDTINVIINGVVPIPNFESLGHCAQNPVYFTDLSTATAGTINSWTWSINGEIFSNEQNPILAEPNPQLETSEPETKEIVLSIQTSDGCGDFITQDLTIYPLPVVSFFPDLVCQNTELEFTSTSFVNGGEIIYNEWDFPTSWLNGAESNLVTATSSGTHIVQLISTSSVGCTDSILHLVFVKPAPLPEFTAANTCVGQSVSFINSTIFNPVISALEWSWDFGDENNANVSSPQHIYQEAGAYDVNLGVSYSNGCELSTINNIEIYHNPDVNLDNLNACEGAAFTLSSQASVLSGNIESYNWQIGNPVIIESQLSELEINIAASGKFPIKHTVSSNLGCKTIINDTLIVHENPLAAFSASRTWGAVPLWIDFTNNSQDAESYYWQFDPENFSTDENPYHIFTDSGTYVVQLSSFNQYGCYDTAELTIRSVIPIMDIMLYSLRTVIKDNYLTISVYIINKGTLPVAELNLDLNLGNGKIYRETIENFQSGQVIDYTFSFKPYLSGGTLPEVVCVEAPDPTYSIYTDIDFSNNIICNTNVENLILFQPYPNPASDNFICEFITAKTEDVQVLLINGLGKIVYDKQFKNNTGYTKTTIDISTLLQGIYYFQVRTADESKSYKVEVN
ncbi:MAG: PKD domain-containing protein, partial [Bacteroidales bacterium]|nr:PKD domain-containing protein [Bacteroidales bacterium]